MPELTAEARRIVGDVARRHGVSEGAVEELLAALVAGGGSQAQFNHPELGGMGQWSQGGMVMVGDMFNNALKAQVDALCAELAGLLRAAGPFASAAASRQSQSQSQVQPRGIGVSLFVPRSLASAEWWPAELGSPASVGAQNELRYAFFPATRRLAIAQGSQVTVYDTGDHRIGGFSQQQSGDQSLSFTSQHGVVRVADLPVDGGQRRSRRASAGGIHRARGGGRHLRQDRTACGAAREGHPDGPGVRVQEGRAARPALRSF
jgi:hypothetical protein